MKTINKLTLIVSVAVLSCASAHGMFRSIGSAAGNVMSTTGRVTTGALGTAQRTASHLTGVQTEKSELVSDRGFGYGRGRGTLLRTTRRAGRRAGRRYGRRR